VKQEDGLHLIHQHQKESISTQVSPSVEHCLQEKNCLKDIIAQQTPSQDFIMQVEVSHRVFASSTT
jgi:hypothetical protein